MKRLPGENRSGASNFFPVPSFFDPSRPMVKPSPSGVATPRHVYTTTRMRPYASITIVTNLSSVCSLSYLVPKRKLGFFVKIKDKPAG